MQKMEPISYGNNKLSNEYCQIDAELYSKYKQIYVDKFQRKIEYGTAGFRDKSEFLEMICLRVGIFSAELAKYRKNAVIGVMITASHNPIEDNGLKIVDYDGNMLNSAFEKVVQSIANEEDINKGYAGCREYLEKFFGEDSTNKNGVIIVGYDTRPSSINLAKLFCLGATNNHAKIYNFEQVTTPQLHFLDTLYNMEDLKKPLEDYYDHFGGCFSNFFENLEKIGCISKEHKKNIILDCANGIGGLKIQHLIEKYLSTYINVHIINGNETKYLNDTCGSEFVQKEKKKPRCLDELMAKFPSISIENSSFLSFDGDADRTVYFYPSSGPEELKIMEGDKLGALFGLWLIKILKEIKEDQQKLDEGGLCLFEDFSKWKIGVVLTAYANGAAKNYYESLGLPVVVEKTGVKYLHAAAHQFDIGIYFESNGHGNVIYLPKLIEKLKDAISSLNMIKSNLPDHWPIEMNHKTENILRNLQFLELFLSLANQGTGDAISNFLMVECALAHLKMNSAYWNSLYTDFPSINQKIKIRNKAALKTIYNETRLNEPIILQEQLDDLIKKYSKARAFIRPSGTEDVVRLYVESETLEDTKQLVYELTNIVISNKDIN